MQFIKSIYIHLPFCLKKCPYCVFPVHFIGKKAENVQNLTQTYISKLQKEIVFSLQKHKTDKNIKKPLLKTLYFGGGTPSLIKPREIERVFLTIEEFYRIDKKETEISIELNPETFDEEDIDGYLKLGVNRFSIGIQSFDNEILSNLLKRGHTVEDITKSLDILKSFKIPNISWDLLMNLPYEKDPKTMFLLSKKYIERYNPSHLSIYSLILEEDSIFKKKLGLTEGKWPMVSEDFAAEQYEFIHKSLSEMGYLHYEISSFAKNEQFICKHNEIYWQGDKDFFAFGMGATSLLSGLRVTRPQTLKKYYDYVENFDEKYLQIEKEFGLEQVKSILMGGLRTSKGVFLGRFSSEIKKKIKEFYNFNKEFLDLDDSDFIRLKGVRGFLLCDEILTRIFLELEKK